jgi:hypothetical protein
MHRFSDGTITRVLALVVALTGAVAPAPAAPTFSLPGHEAEAARLGELLALHLPDARSECALWDPWLPQSTLWAATGAGASAQGARDFYRRVLLRRKIDGEGYVSMQQHRGMAHSEGWPFPAWQQSTGRGWHFSIEGEGWAVQNFKQEALTTIDGWDIQGAMVEGIDPGVGLKLVATADTVTLTTPAFSCGTIVAPFIRVEWAAEGVRPGPAGVEWLLDGEAEWPAGRRAEFPGRTAGEGMGYANVPVHRQPGYAGLLTRLRLVIPAGAGATVSLKSILTAIDTRHPITNAVFVQASADYFNWTTDLPFLRENLPRMRRALAYALDEFDVRAGHHVRVSWVGHDGRSGLARDAAGKRVLRPGLGVGNNYWDLLPFGGHDAMATMQVYAALRRMAALEREVAAAPADWRLDGPAAGLAAGDLDALADAVRTDFRTRFWNVETGRFIGWIDLDGGRHDFGFTFLNTEAIHHGLATPEQEKAVFDWLDGRRAVAGDTSQGADIYRWRFGPRSTTRRNTETYVWAWSHPESIPWGDQVQDGGAVLGFTYYELMARLRVLGPDDAWRRLREVLGWFGEVQAEGGYRAYYAKPGRGTLQGGGPAGGLGFDREFMESVLLPQVMVYGFLGAEPRPDGLVLAPRLPAAWPSAGLDGVHVQGHVFDVTVTPGEVALTCRTASEAAFALWLPAGRWEVEGGLPAAAAAVHEFTAGGPPVRLRWSAGQRRSFRRLSANS